MVSESEDLHSKLPAIGIKSSDLDFIDSPFDSALYKNSDILLPEKEIDRCLSIDLCPITNISITAGLDPLYLLRYSFPLKNANAYCVVSIKMWNPPLSLYTLKLLAKLQLWKESSTILLVLHPMAKSSVSQYEAAYANHNSIVYLRLLLPSST